MDTAQPTKHKSCRRCAATFTPLHPNRKNSNPYCSRACVARAGSERRKASRVAACEGCGVEFHPSTDGGRFCSLACFNSAKQTRAKCVCVFCQQEYTPKNASRKTYCSRDCFFAHTRQVKEERIANTPLRILFTRCAQCGGQFDKPSAIRVYCSTHCHHKATYQSRAKLWAFTCSFCGLGFTRTGKGAGAGGRGKSNPDRYCCIEHCRRHNRVKDRLSGKHKEYQTRRNVMIQSNWVEDVEPQKVFAKDDWRCYLCDVKCDPDANPFGSPNYPTVDHVIPVSKGGEHSYANCRCACRACNQHKCAKVVAAAPVSA